MLQFPYMLKFNELDSALTSYFERLALTESCQGFLSSL